MCGRAAQNQAPWLLAFMQTGIHPANWKMETRSTALSYLKQVGKSGMAEDLRPEDIPAAHRQFFEQMRLFYIDQKSNCFVHAGFNRDLPFLLQPREEYYWNRSLWTQALSFTAMQRGKKQQQQFHVIDQFHNIFIGHTNILNWGTDQPMRAAHIWNINTGAGRGARLTVMDVNTYKFWQSDLIDAAWQ